MKVFLDVGGVPRKEYIRDYAKSGVIDLFPRDCAMYVENSRKFPAEDCVQSAQREH